jgi:hypothetical protein
MRRGLISFNKIAIGNAAFHLSPGGILELEKEQLLA